LRSIQGEGLNEDFGKWNKKKKGNKRIDGGMKDVIGGERNKKRILVWVIVSKARGEDEGGGRGKKKKKG